MNKKLKKILVVMTVVGALGVGMKTLMTKIETNSIAIESDMELDAIGKCWDEQVKIADRSLGINNPYFAQAIMKGRECKERQREFKKKHGREPKCVLDRYNAYECKV